MERDREKDGIIVIMQFRSQLMAFYYSILILIHEWKFKMKRARSIVRSFVCEK